MTRSIPLLGLAGLLVGTAACTEPDTTAAGEPSSLGQRDDAIINGSLDTSHQAVVAWLHGSKCSATIVHVSGSTGYALTAAHCVGGPLGDLRQGNDHNSPTASYPVVEATIHPEYAASNAYDFAMLTFSGATAATPVLPVLPANLDNIVVGTQQELVGYGLTQNGSTSLRHHIFRPVAFQSPLWLGWSQQTGGVCSGDSGGPALHTSSGQQYVSAVHSFVSSPSCDGFGVSVRASAVENTFVQPYIAGTPFLPQSCGQCFDAHTKQGACADEVADCFSNASCEAYADCIQGCSNEVCLVQCALQHSEGKAMYGAIYACGCDDACAAECGGDAMCEPDPICWLEVDEPTCQSCLDSSCCAEASACAADWLCSSCVTSDNPNSNCESHPTLAALTSCLAESCSDECDGEGSGGGGGEGSGGGAAGVTVGAGGGQPIADDTGPLVVQDGCAVSRAPQSRFAAGWLAVLALFAIRRRRQPGR